MGLTAWNGVRRGGFHFVYDPTAGIPALVLEQRATDALQYIREPGGALVARIGPEGVKYYHFDALGSTVALTDASGTVTDRYDYGAWGEYHPLLEGTSDNPYRYVGELGYYAHYQAPALAGAQQLGVRFYEPGVGRFGQLGSPYTYAGNNPLKGPEDWPDDWTEWIKKQGEGACINWYCAIEPSSNFCLDTRQAGLPYAQNNPCHMEKQTPVECQHCCDIMHDCCMFFRGRGAGAKVCRNEHTSCCLGCDVGRHPWPRDNWGTEESTGICD